MISIFYCYAPEDRKFREELDKQLKVMQRQKLIKSFHGENVLPGSLFNREIAKKLHEAQIILLMVSPYLLGSEELYEQQVEPALARRKNGARVIPIIVRPTEGWQKLLGDVAFLPRTKESVAHYKNLNEALYEIATELRRVVEEMLEEGN